MCQHRTLGAKKTLLKSPKIVNSLHNERFNIVEKKIGDFFYIFKFQLDFSIIQWGNSVQNRISQPREMQINVSCNLEYQWRQGKGITRNDICIFIPFDLLISILLNRVGHFLIAK